MPLPNVTAKILSKVIEYCRFHVDSLKKNSEDKPAKTDEEIKTWDNEFVKVDQATLFELILVGRMLCILFTCTCRKRSGMVLSKTAACAFHPGGLPHMQAANYLNIKALLDLGCLTVANMIKGASLAERPCLSNMFIERVGHCMADGNCVGCTGKTPEEIRKMRKSQARPTIWCRVLPTHHLVPVPGSAVAQA